MNREDILNIIKKNTFLNEDEKKNWIERLTNADESQLQGMTPLFEWYKKNSEDIQNKKETLLTQIFSTFSAMDKEAYHKAILELNKYSESTENEKDREKTASLLKELENL